MQYLMQHLACPQCQAKLLASPLAGRLLCAHCHAAYRQEANIWILLSSEAKPLHHDEAQYLERRPRLGQAPKAMELEESR